MNRADMFLTELGWQDATRHRLAADASTRRYERLERGAETVILMLAPPEESAAFDAFLNIANLLTENGLSSPRILGHDRAAGLMLLEDLGCHPFATLVADRHCAVSALADLLSRLDALRPTHPLERLTPEVMAEMTAISLPNTPEAKSLQTQMATLFAGHFSQNLTLSLRDVHGENLLWLPERAGAARVGLLDFQDAVMAPRGYDLVSYIHDVRRDVADEDQRVLVKAFVDSQGLEPFTFDEQIALLSFQRNLRILGVFRHLAEARGKPQYLTHLPRVRAHVARALTHSVMSPIRAQALALLPEIAI